MEPDQEMRDNKTESQDLQAPDRRGRSHIAAFLVLLVVLLVTLLIIVLPQFHIQNIDIVGCREISGEALLTSSGIASGDHLLRNLGGGFIQLFTLRYGNIEKELARNYPYISDIKIQIVFPSRVLITVIERQKIGYVELPDSYAVIDTDGYVVELSGDDIPDGVPLMQGLPVRTAVLGEKIDMTEGKGLNTCISVLNAVLTADENKSSESDMSLLKCVKSIRSVQSGITFMIILLPDTQRELLVRIGSIKNITDDMSWLRYAASQNKFESVGEGVLDMSGEEYTFRPMN